MKVLVTGSAGHLGEALVRTLRTQNYDVVGVDTLPSDFTSHVGSIVDREFVKQVMTGVDAVIHSATLHKPHVATHSKQDFIDTNITGTLNLLEESVVNGVKSFVFTSSTSVFGDALAPHKGEPSAWITESVTPIPKNIYGVTKIAAEDLCQLFYRNHKLPCIILRTSRFFPEEDDNKDTRDSYIDCNAKVNEYLYRRVDIEDAVSAHILAVQQAHTLGFRKFIISATAPFEATDSLLELHQNAPAIVAQKFPDFLSLYTACGWKMFDHIDRVYVNEAAQTQLGWKPKYDFQYWLDVMQSALLTVQQEGSPSDSSSSQINTVDTSNIAATEVEADVNMLLVNNNNNNSNIKPLVLNVKSPMAVLVGEKGYHGGQTFADCPFPV